MKRHKLTEQEIRAIATEYASTQTDSFGGRTLEQWFSDYMKHYDTMMDIIKHYNAEREAQ